MQYDDFYLGTALKPLTRKFTFTNTSSRIGVKLRAAIVLDQVQTPDSAKAYLLTRTNGQYKKYPANQTNVSAYDPEVQKLSFDSIILAAYQAQEIVLMQKQPPIMTTAIIEMYSGETKSFPIATFVIDPDSVKGDITITSPNQNITSNTSFVTLTAPQGLGNTSFILTATHDFLTATQTYTVKVLPPDFNMPTAFTPNNDGKNDILKPVVHGKLSNYRIIIFNRYGQKVFESTEPTKGWDGTINGIKQGTGTYVYVVSHQFEGDKQIETKGTVVLLK
jgi:gliding motility-associated-like protein